MKRAVPCALLLSAAGIVASAQESVTVSGDHLMMRKLNAEAGNVLFQTAVPAMGPIQYVASEMSFDGQVVKGAAYSAQAVTETTQTLADGNRIHRTVSASVYRDSEGRTRREQTLAGIGPFGPPVDAPKTIFINDPVANTNYVLEPNNKIARKMPAPPSLDQLKTQLDQKMAAEKAAGGNLVQMKEAHMITVQRAGVAGGNVAFATSTLSPTGAPPDVKTESLGNQVVEGISADGTRNTMTIPAGQIGNDRPIEIVSERWYSPDLQTVVMTRHTDPRMGETVYKLTNISRSEPSPALFQVPADYTVSDGGKAGFFHMRVPPPAEANK